MAHKTALEGAMGKEMNAVKRIQWAVELANGIG